MTDLSKTPDPSVMTGVIPYLAFGGRAAEAIAFYTRAFGATDLGRMPDPERPEMLMHAQIEINGGAFMMTDHTGDGPRAETPLPHGHLQLMVADGRAWWDRAVAAGCTEVMPYERQFWGDDWGLLRDPFGIQWSVAQPGPEHAA
ncbi:VOC family protein [Pararhodobacter sp.]|uniref:VOC family protein n=1 Tax=Pararhodobacter sp. TaxID=2127056 RepID=UPI002FDCADD7